MSVPISDLTEAAISDLLPLARLGMLSDACARQWLVRRVIEEGMFALADRCDETGSFRLIIRFDVSDGERRFLARAQEAEQIDAILEGVAK